MRARARAGARAGILHARTGGAQSARDRERRRAWIAWAGHILAVVSWFSLVGTGEGSGHVAPTQPSTRLDHMFGKNVIEPLREGLPKGWVNVQAGPVPWFNSVLRRNESALIDCGGDAVVNACVYNVWLLFWVFLGGGGFLVAAFVLTFFCCGRCLISRCGPPCCASSCGGWTPTQEYSDCASWCNLVSMIVLGLLIGVLSIFGFAASLQVSQDLLLTFRSVAEVRSYLPALRGDVVYRLNRLKQAAKRDRRNYGPYLTGLNQSVILTQNARGRTLELQESILELRRLVEGCARNVTAEERLCEPTGSVDINTCAGTPPAHMQPDASLSASASITAGTRNPACRAPDGSRTSCPCCTTCDKLQGYVAEVIGNLPNGLRDYVVLGSGVGEAALDYSRALERGVESCVADVARDSQVPLDALVQSPLWGYDQVWETHKFFNASAAGLEPIPWVALGVFSPSWIAILASLLGLLLSLKRAGGHGVANTAWWTAFCFAGIAFLYALLLTGSLSLISIPLSDICRVLPSSPTDTPARLLRALSPSGVLNDTQPSPQVQGAVTQCLAAGLAGSIFDAVPPSSEGSGLAVVRASVDRHLAPGVVFPPQAVSKSLDIEAHAQPVRSKASEFASIPSRYEEEMGWQPGDSCATATGAPAAATWNCSRDHAAYKEALDQRVSAITTALARFTTAVGSAEEYAVTLRRNLTALGGVLDADNARLAAAAFAAGNCSAMSGRYLDAYASMCGSGGLVFSLDTVWGCVLFLALLYVVYLPMLMWALKIAHQAREGPWRPPRPPNARPSEIAFVRIYLDESYPKITASTLARKTFEDAVLEAVVECLQCPKAWVQVEDIRRGSVVVDLSLWAPEQNESNQTCSELVEELLRQAQDPLSTLYRLHVTRKCFRIESLDAHGLELTDKQEQVTLTEAADDAEKGANGAASRQGGAGGNVKATSPSRSAQVEPEDAISRYREWSDKNIKDIKGVHSVARKDSTAYIPPPPPHQPAQTNSTKGEAKSGIEELVLALGDDFVDPLKGLRPADAEDSIFGNPWQAIQEVRLEIEGMQLEAEEQNTVLHKACRRGKKLEVDAILKESRAGIDVGNAKGATGLYLAAQEGHLPVVELLLKSGARKDAATNEGWTPLFVAAYGGHAEVVEELLDWRADVEAASSQEEFKGWTPLHAAASQGHMPVVSLLVKARANRLALTTKGETAAQLATSGTHPAIAEYLASKGTSLAAEAVRRLGPQRLPVTQVPGLR